MGLTKWKMCVLCRLAHFASTLVLYVILVNTSGVISSSDNEPSLRERGDPTLRPYNHLVAFQGFHGGRVRIDIPQLLREQAAAGWVDDTPPTALSGSTVLNYSVIVVEWRTHSSNLFREEARVRAHTGNKEGTVRSVQFASPFPPTSCEDAGCVPFFVGHPDGSDKRVRMVYATDLVEKGFELDPRQVSHLEAACQDPSETTILVMVDETCECPEPPLGMPAACLSNVVRIYPFNDASSAHAQSRNAYIPLGPRDTFPFVAEERRRAASERSLLFNSVVSARTSVRRKQVVEIVRQYTASNPDVPCVGQPATMDEGEWQELLLDSKFTISPGGHNPETYRTWEALEAGSIPIVSKLDFTHPAYEWTTSCGVGTVAWDVVAASPFAKEVSVEDWTQLPVLLNRLRAESDDYINRLQAASYEWYSAVMNRTYASALNFGEGQELFPQDGPILDHVH